MRYSKSKAINQLVKILITQHQCTFHRGRKHNRVYSKKAKCAISIATTPGDINAHHQFYRDIKRYFNIKL